MKTILLTLVATAALAGLPSFAGAAPATPATGAEATTAVKAMFDAMEMRRNMVAMYAELQKTMPAMLQRQAVAMVQADTRLDAAQKRQALDRIERMLPALAESIGRILGDQALVDEMIEAMVPLYTRHYTAGEIRQLTAFYSSPVGRKMMALTPQLSTEGMAIGQRIMMPRIARLMQDMVQDAQKP
ncbi:DUF2059 domain-containing protein [Massilia sp. MS-15]|uniref:DUF2059 domain-containing protein n=1 Tax=Massilia sp. MS-15 TaxID=2878200 RepID=UPI001CD39A3C|nr:DUF2059 domain-containing protein [Massilia sp. MS-15]MCA1246990.1 DUF2059 domain-containing protein [Massilia sp. MS-15]